MIKGSVQAAPAAAVPAKPEAPALRMVALPEAFSPIVTPAKAPAAPPSAASQPAKVAAAPVPPTQRIPVPTPVMPVAATREVAPLASTRTASLQTPRASETVRARELVEPAVPNPAPATERTERPAPVERAQKIERPEKPASKAVATRKAPAPARAAEKATGTAPATVAQAEPAEAEDTEVLGIKLPSLAPAGRKLKESVDALGNAVKNVF